MTGEERGGTEKGRGACVRACGGVQRRAVSVRRSSASLSVSLCRRRRLRRDRCPLPPSLSECRSSQRPLRPTYEGNPSEKAKRGDQQPRRRRRPAATKAEVGKKRSGAAGMNILRKGGGSASFSDSSSAAASRHPHRHYSPSRRFSLLQWRLEAVAAVVLRR